MTISKIQKILYLVLIIAVITISLVVLLKSNLPAQNTQTTSQTITRGYEELSESERREYSELIEKCDLYSRQSRYDELIQVAKKAIVLAPNEPQGYNCLSHGYAGQRNYSEAIKASSKYIEIMKSSHLLTPNAVMVHADFLLKGRGAEEAIKFLEEYREMSPVEIDMVIEFIRTGKVTIPPPAK